MGWWSRWVYIWLSPHPRRTVSTMTARRTADGLASGLASETVSGHRQFRQRGMDHINHARRTRLGQVSDAA